MRKAFKYRLYPSKSQETILFHTLDLCRHLYNAAIAERKDAWRHGRHSISFKKQCEQLPLIKDDRPEYKTDVYSQVLQDVLHRVDKAYAAFFRRIQLGQKPGYPRFRGLGRYDSFTYPQLGFAIAEGSVNLAKIGTIQMLKHRDIEGNIKTCCIRRNSSGKWFAVFSCDDIPEKPLPESFDFVGIDVGLTTFAALSNGKKIKNPRFFKRDERDLARAQRKLAKQAKGTPSRKRSRRVVQHIHERIATRRMDFAHQESRRIVNKYGIISVEDLAIKEMMQDKENHYAKSIADVAWSQFRAFLSFKAESAGRKFIAVNPAYTSQNCSSCGHRQKMPLSKRVYRCPSCGLVLNRDHNAALNILAIGLDSLGSIPRSPAL